MATTCFNKECFWHYSENNECLKPYVYDGCEKIITSEPAKNEVTLPEQLFTKDDLKKAWLHGELRVPEKLKHCNNFDVYFKKAYPAKNEGTVLEKIIQDPTAKNNVTDSNAKNDDPVPESNRTESTVNSNLHELNETIQDVIEQIHALVKKHNLNPGYFQVRIDYLKEINNTIEDLISQGYDKKEIPEGTTKNDVLRCSLSNAELLKKCREWINKLIETGGRAWNLHIPARLNDDPDLLFAELTWRFKKLLREKRTGSTTTKNDYTVLDEIAHKLTLFADVKILALLELPDVDVVYILNKIKLAHSTQSGNNVPTLEDAMQIGYYFNNFRESIKKLKRKTGKDDDKISLADGVKLLLNKVLFKLSELKFNFILAEANDLSPWTNAEFFIKNDLVEYRLYPGETAKNDDTAGDFSQEEEETEPNHSCPKCGRDYDDADFDFQICHFCGWDSNENKYVNP